MATRVRSCSRARAAIHISFRPIMLPFERSSAKILAKCNVILSLRLQVETLGAFSSFARSSSLVAFFVPAANPVLSSPRTIRGIRSELFSLNTPLSRV